MIQNLPQENFDGAGVAQPRNLEKQTGLKSRLARKANWLEKQTGSKSRPA
jgi:hypothetical protein